MRANLLLFLTLSLILSSCSKSSSSKDGGQDGGGGHVQISSAQDVRNAIARALEFASSSKIEYNALYPFAVELMVSNERSQAYADTSAEKKKLDAKALVMIFNIAGGISDPACALEFGQTKMKDCPSLPASFYNTLPDSFMTHMAEVLKRSRGHMHFLESGDCGSAKDNHADASVSAFKFGADICFSIGNLRRIPPSALMQEILSLVVHEIAHLHGYGEADAQFLQSVFSEFYSARFGNLSRERHKYLTELTFDRIHSLVEDARQDVTNQKAVFANLAEAAQLVEDLPFAFDPLALKILYDPKLELSELGYSTAAVKFLVATRAWLKYQISPPAPADQPKEDDDLSPLTRPEGFSRERLGATAGDELNWASDEVQDMLNNWKFLTGESTGHLCIPEINVMNLYPYQNDVAAFEKLKDFMLLHTSPDVRDYVPCETEGFDEYLQRDMGWDSGP